jgi:hypothetical protein
MAQYLVAIYHPDDYDPSIEDEAISRDIDALNRAKSPGTVYCAAICMAVTPVILGKRFETELFTYFCT